MGSKRTLILIAAVLVGTLAAYALYTYVGGVEDRAYEDAQLVEVYVVRQAIPQNTSLDTIVNDKLVSKDQIPLEFRPSTAVTDLGALAGQVTQVPLDPNQVLVSGMFAQAGKVYGTFSERIRPGEVAVTINVDQVRGVAGLLVPGDLVNLMVTLEQKDDSLGAPKANADGTSAPYTGEKGVRTLYQNAYVLAVGQNAEAVSSAESSGDSGGTTGLITFSVRPEAAERVTLAANEGALWLALTSPGYEPQILDGIREGELFATGQPTPSATPAAGA